MNDDKKYITDYKHIPREDKRKLREIMKIQKNRGTWSEGESWLDLLEQHSIFGDKSFAADELKLRLPEAFETESMPEAMFGLQFSDKNFRAGDDLYRALNYDPKTGRELDNIDRLMDMIEERRENRESRRIDRKMRKEQLLEDVRERMHLMKDLLRKSIGLSKR
jgi:uncharacterized protein with von Willebrand factor type A (vWA) domain